MIHIAIGKPTNAAGSGAQVKAGTRPARRALQRPTGHRARQRGHENLLDRVLNDQLAPGAAHGALAGREAPLHGAGRQRRHGAMCKWIWQTDWRPMACGRPVSGQRCPAELEGMTTPCSPWRAAFNSQTPLQQLAGPHKPLAGRRGRQRRQGGRGGARRVGRRRNRLVGLTLH